MSPTMPDAHSGSAPPPRDDAWDGHYLYSAASSYPEPTAIMIDSSGLPVHSWTNAVDQVPEAEDPPTFLRGWNHVALHPCGHLVALVPLRSVVMLDSASNVVWRSPIAAHHDIDFTPDGNVVVLAENARPALDGESVVLDSDITVLDDAGRIMRSQSLYELLVRDPVLGAVVEQETAERRAKFRGVREDLDAEALSIFNTGQSDRPVRDALRMVRQLPGSPADVLHANALRLLPDHPSELWRAGAVLVSLRNLDTIAVVDLDAQKVVWSWGRGVLSGQHQPTPVNDGRILVFDNGVRLGRSRLLEIDPIGSTVTWSYLGDPPKSFFTALAGGCELLPNGDVLVTEARTGQAFVVTRDGERVWSWSLPSPSENGRSSRVGLYRMSAVDAETAAAVLG